MTHTNASLLVPSYKASLRAIPLHFSAACFIGALITDTAYWRTAEMAWANFSAWLLTAGLLLGGVALLAGLFDLVRGRFRFAGIPAILYLLGAIAVLVVSLFNAFVHGRDGWTSVVPTGLALSIAAVVLIILVAIFGRISERRFARGY